MLVLGSVMDAQVKAFDVASIKPTKSTGPMRAETLPGGRLLLRNVTLRWLILYAYGGAKDYLPSEGCLSGLMRRTT